MSLWHWLFGMWVADKVLGDGSSAEDRYDLSDDYDGIVDLDDLDDLNLDDLDDLDLDDFDEDDLDDLDDYDDEY